jgi:hypothetical protein
MNKKAEITNLSVGIAVVVAIFLFMVGIMNVNFIKDEVSRTRNVENLNCADSSISDGAKLACLAVDLVIPYFIIIILSASGGYVIGRFVV